MTVPLSTVAQMALRRLGVRVVPLDDSPTLTEMVPFADIATAALEELGILNADATPPAIGTVPQSEIATSALIELGVLNSVGTPVIGIVPTTEIATAAFVELGVLNSADMPATGTVPASEIATGALVELGVLNSDIPPDADTSPGADIATLALIELGVIASDETPSTSDQALAASIFSTVHFALQAQGIADWPEDAIPFAFMGEYTKLTAINAASSFGKTADPSLVAMLETRIRVGAAVLNNDTPFMTNLVSDVHASLVAHGIADWTTSTIPRAFAEDYIKLTVAYAAASFGKQVDPASVAMFEDRIRAGAMVLNNDAAFMDGLVSDVHNSLIAQGIAWWDESTIPRAFAEEYIKLTVAFAAASFGKQVDPNIVKMLEERVRAGAIVMNNGQTFMLEQVSFVHGSLQGQGIASWGLDAIPRSVAEDYIKLTVAYSAASFGKQVDPAIIAMLESHARKSALVVTVNQGFMLDKLASVHAALDAQGVVWWPSGSAPRAFAEEYTKLAAAMVAPMFDKQADPNMVELLEKRIRMGVMVLSSDSIANQHAQAVHDDFAMRGLVRWSSFDIPEAVGDAYSWLAASRMAPLFETKVDPQDTRAAETAIYRYIALPSSGEVTPAVYF